MKVFLKDPIVEEAYERLSSKVEIVTNFDHPEELDGIMVRTAKVVTMQNLLQDADIPALLSDTYEADDLADTLANIHKNDMTVRIVTKDKDYLQLVDDACDVRVCFLPTPKDLEEKG